MHLTPKQTASADQHHAEAINRLNAWLDDGQRATLDAIGGARYVAQTALILNALPPIQVAGIAALALQQLMTATDTRRVAGDV